ncbi:MAG: hypothetical protein ABI134_27995 [Byssovorax sp.]
MMESNRTDRVDPELVEIAPQSRHGSDPHLAGNNDPSPWAHEVTPGSAGRARAGQGKLVAALFATSVFLGTGFSIGAPVYALSRWWASRPVATATLETRNPVAAQTAGEPPANEAMPSSAAAKSTLVLGELLDEEVMQVAPLGEAAAIEATSEEAVALPEAPVAVLSSEPPPAGPVWSEIPVSSTPFIDPVAIARVTIDPVAIDRFTIDPVTIERVTIDPVPIERVTIDPVVIDPVSIGRVTIDPVAIDRVTIDPISY